MALDFSTYDTRHYVTLGVREGYEAWAPLYDAQMDGNLDLVLLDRLTGVDWSGIGAAVDLACGTGRIGSWLAERGVASIEGVDLTARMLDEARSKGVYRRLLEEDMAATSLPDGSADLVVNCLAIGHVPELGPTYREADRLLRPAGRFVLIGYHPYFLLAGIPTHFKSTGGEPIAIRNSIHLISDHVDAGVARRWTLVEMHERIVDERWVSRAPTWRRHLNKPASFAMLWRKPASADLEAPRAR
jgi:SAM-dependent methyltransferase